jgi:hypothetical protein
MTDRENQRLAILSFIDTHPGTEAGQIGVALAPAGTPNQRTWAVANIAPIRWEWRRNNPPDHRPGFSWSGRGKITPPVSLLLERTSGRMFGVDLYRRVRLAVFRDGLSQRAAALRFGIDRGTVAKMLEHSAPPGYRRKAEPRRPKLEAHAGFIDQILFDDLNIPKKQRKHPAPPPCRA